MAVTEQQFIEAYKGMDTNQQQKTYSAGNQQVKQWIDNYNASQNTTTNQAPQDLVDQGYYKSGAWNDIGGKNVGDWNYGTDTPERQQEIINNLNQAYAQDPSRFKDWNTFADNFNYMYTGRSEKERETMRNWYSSKVGQVPEGTPGYGNIYGTNNPNDISNTDYFFNQLLQGTPLTGNGAAVASAQIRYKNYQSLSSMTPDQIASAVSSGAINGVGQEMIDLKNYSPTLYAQVQAQLQGKTQVDDINATGEGIYNGLTKTETNGNYTKYDFTTEYTKNASVIKQYNENLYKQIEGLGGDTAAYVAIVASMLQNPLIQANKDEIENLEGEINKINEQMYKIGDTARSVLGSEAPEDLVSAYISHQTKQLQNQLRTTQNSLLVAQGKLDNQLSEVETMLDAINQGIKTYGEGGTGSSNYQYVSGTKYQEAGYFDKNTGQFYKLGETPDTRDYQTDDPTRLQEIADNLTNIANSDDVYVFRDRSAFNDYFKYSQRGTAQKQVLDNFWNANAEKLKAPAQAAWTKYQNSLKSKGTGGGGGGNYEDTSDDKWKKLMKGIINGDVAGSYDKGNVKRYGFTAGLNEQEVVKKIAQICTPADYNSLYTAFGPTAGEQFKTEIKTRIQTAIKNNSDNIKARMKSAGASIGNKKREAEAEKLASELGINFGTLGKDAIISYYKSL